MKYQVIIFLDETRNRSYYHSYIESEDTTLGNIECSDLPPYQDINKARACYWDIDKAVWIFDEEKYQEILQAEAQAKAEQEEAEAIAASTPSNLELMEAIMEIAQNQSDLAEAVAELGELVAINETE